MADRQTFGRRGLERDGIKPTAPTARVKRQSERRPVDAPARRQAGPARPVAPSAEDVEIREWKRQRRERTSLPWRSISLTASLCFGVGAFVLPDALNGVLDWILYGLAAASFLAGRRRKARQQTP